MKHASVIALVVAVLVAGGVYIGGGDDAQDERGAVLPKEPSGVRVLSPDDLFGVTFVLHRAAGFKLVEGTTMELAFSKRRPTGDLAQSLRGGFHLWFNAGCNSARGLLTLTNNRLVPLDGIGMTEMGCDGPRHRQESWLMDFFMEEPKVSLNGDTLTMVAKGATLTFLDKKVAVPDKPLVGTQWTARRIIDRKSVGWMQMDKYPTLHFSTDGALTIFNGCNQVKGRFTAKRSVLTLTEMAPTTMRLCTGDNVQRMVAHYAKVFVDGTLSYSIDANALNIERGGDGVVAYTE